MKILSKTIRFRIRRHAYDAYSMETMETILNKMENRGYPESKLISKEANGSMVILEYKFD